MQITQSKQRQPSTEVVRMHSKPSLMKWWSKNARIFHIRPVRRLKCSPIFVYDPGAGMRIHAAKAFTRLSTDLITANNNADNPIKSLMKCLVFWTVDKVVRTSEYWGARTKWWVTIQNLILRWPAWKVRTTSAYREAGQDWLGMQTNHLDWYWNQARQASNVVCVGHRTANDYSNDVNGILRA